MAATWSGLLLLAVAGAAMAGSTPGAPAVALTVPALDAEATALDLGMYLNLSLNASNVSGGSGDVSNYSYAWHGLPAGCTGTDAANVSCVPSGTGTSSITVTVTDVTGNLSGDSPATSVTVSSDPQITALTPSATSVAVNGTLTFSVTASGGTAPYSYAWNGLPAGCQVADTTATCTPTVAQTYNVTVVATDAAGWSTDPAFVIVTVTASSTTASTGPTLLDWGIIGAILVIGLGLSAALFVRARNEERKGMGGPAAKPPPPPS